ncbi:RIKEN cDNA 5330416C01, isoform CRA_a, partial [Mus musculus]
VIRCWLGTALHGVLPSFETRWFCTAQRLLSISVVQTRLFVKVMMENTDIRHTWDLWILLTIFESSIGRVVRSRVHWSWLCWCSSVCLGVTVASEPDSRCVAMEEQSAVCCINCASAIHKQDCQTASPSVCSFYCPIKRTIWKMPPGQSIHILHLTQGSLPT